MLIACSDCHRQYKVGDLKPGSRVNCHCGGVAEVRNVQARDARMVHCSSCGANVTDGATSCGYCGSGITLADHKLGQCCPECFARLCVDAKFCGGCGVSIEPEEITGSPVTETCPRCEGIMVLRQVRSGSFSECTTCGGMWLEEGSFERMVEKRDEQAMGGFTSTSTRLEPAAESGTGPEINTQRYIPCPVCTELMNRKNFAGCSGVVLDWCKGHGYWFDRNELQEIVQFVQAGGMDRARSRELDNARRDLERTKRQAASARTSPYGPTVPVAGGTALFSTRDTEPAYDIFEGIVSLVRGLFKK